MNPAPTVIIGNVTQDPELTFTANGQARLSFSVAANYVWYDQAGEKQEKVSFFNIVAWRNLAEDCANVLTKGVRVVVTGRLEQRSWDDKESGAKRSTVEVLADNIGLSVGNIETFVRKQKAEGQTGSYAPKAKTASAPARTAPKPIAQVQLEEQEAW